MSAYENLWKKAARYYGATGQPAPTTSSYVPQSAGYSDKPALAVMHYDDQGRSVQYSPKMEKWLGTTAKGVGVKRNSARGKTIRARRRSAQETLLHEWAHIYQDPAVLKSEGLDKEQLANAFASRVAEKLLNGEQPSPVLMSDLRAKYGPGYIMRGQFGSNYGTDPTTIR